MNKTYKVISVLIVALIIMLSCTSVFAATPAKGGQTQDAGGQNQDIFGIMKAQGTTTDDTATQTIGKIGGTIVNIITTVGMVLAVVVIAIIGIKYMVGSPEEKSDYKKSLMPYLIGAVLIFGASAIGRTVYNFGKSIDVEADKTTAIITPITNKG